MISALRTVATAAIIAAVCTTASAYDSRNNYALEGPGRIACSGYTEMVRAGDRRLDILAGWTLGYLSAHNRLLENTYDLTPWQTPETILSLAGQYCEANPDRPFEAALVALMRALNDSRATERTEIVRVGTEDDFVLVYDETLRRAQAALSRAGFDPTGDAEKLSMSLRAYQAEKGLPPTGVLDQPTLAALLPPVQPAAQ